MAVIPLVPTTFPSLGENDGISLVGWTPLANGDTGAPATLPAMADRSVQVSGTWGSGGSITIQGSLDGVTYFPLTDPQGNAITKTANFLEAISEVVRFIRPSVTAGDATTALTCYLLSRKA